MDSHRQTQTDTERERERERERDTQNTVQNTLGAPEGTLPGPSRVHFEAGIVRPGGSRGWRGR
eukprot:3078575-Rhodomonas_salina.5